TPVFQCKQLIKKHGIRVFSSNYTLYSDMSERVMSTLAEFTPELEIYSIDEAFLSLTGFDLFNLTEYARLIRATVKKYTGIPLSIGIGPTKVLSKVANKIAKRHHEHQGIFDLTDHPQIDEILHTIDVSDIWGIGCQYSALLKGNRIRTALDLKNASD